jgi:polysaccharide pyruvyl transferase WcaK-like protein
LLRRVRHNFPRLPSQIPYSGSLQSGQPKPLRVAVQTGSYELDNLGDRAMLEVLIDRLRELHPGTRISVFARDAERVRSLERAVEQIPVEQKREWAMIRSLYLGVRRAIPTADWFMRRRRPVWYESILRIKARALVNAEVLANTDMLIVSGGGFITDVFPGQAWPVLERMAAAIRQNVPFALVGQGIGPLRDPALLQKAREVLPHAKLIAVRETIYSLPLLLEIGVARASIAATGDDAIEPAYEARSETPGTMLGVNFRVAEYAGITQWDVDRLRPTMRSVASRLETEMVALPVCIVDSVESASDSAVLTQLVDPRVSADPDPLTPAALIERIRSCRVVVTGSYHAAVFALAQGIPAICVFNTEYYGNKFRGLADEFGAGCIAIDKSRPEFVEVLVASIDTLWARADQMRPSLLRAAAAQISAGDEAYSRLADILGASRSPIAQSRGAVA